jgi:nucleotide-binding universal stress UspA family protein
MTAGPFRRVLVGWDCSPGAAAALRAAAAIADFDTGHVVALAVLRPSLAESEEDRIGDLDSRRRQVHETFGKARLEASRESRARVTLQFAESSDPARTVCDYADEYAFDLLVLGRHGNGGVLHPRLGRVAETAAKRSGMPLLLLGRR